MSYCDLEEPSLYALREPLARREHDCCECAAPIIRGERYLRVAAKWPGDKKPQVLKQHIACAEACEAVRDADLYGGCLAFGGLNDFWSSDGRDMKKSDPDVAECRRKYAVVVRRVHRETRRA